MSESKFSMNFHAYNGEALPVQVTVRGDTFDEFNANVRAFFGQYPQLGGLDMLLREAPEGSLMSKRYRIVGWLRGYTEDNRNGSERPCVYLYSDLPNVEYKVATVYEEDLGKLPASVDWRRARSVGQQAPMVDKARNQWNACDFKIVLVPRFNFEGKPVLGKNGKPSYKFSHVEGMEGAATDNVTGDDADFGMGQNSGTARETDRAVAAQAESKREALSVFARIMHDPDIQIPKPVSALIQRVTKMDRESQYRMSVNRTENGEQKRGQYEFLCGMIDSLAAQTLNTQDEFHGPVLSALCGRPVTKDDLPGSGLRTLIDEIWPGNKTKKNENLVPATVDALRDLIRLVYRIAAGETDEPQETGLPF